MENIFACSARIFNYNKDDEFYSENLFCGVTIANCTEEAEQKTIRYLKRIFPSSSKIHTVLVTKNVFHDDTNTCVNHNAYILEE